MTMWLAPRALALLFRWRFCFAFLFAFRCFVGSADAGSLFLPDTFRKQMVRGGFCAKKYRATAAVSRENSLRLSIYYSLLGFACLVLLAWSCPLGLFHFVRGERLQHSMHTYFVSLIKAWCLYDNGTPALLHNAFPIGERRPE